MTIRLAQKYLFIITTFVLLWTQTADDIAQKIVIENSYQQKVTASLSSLLGEEKFLVIVSIEFSTFDEGTLKQTPNLQSSNNQSTYIPGLPTVPSTNTSAQKPFLSNNSKSTNNKNLNIGRVDVIIGLDESSINGSIKQEIKSVVQTIIPQTQNCDDCIKIQSMVFQTNKKNDEIENLKNEISKLQSEIRQSKLDTDEKHLSNLERQLSDAQSKIDAAEAIAYRREIERIEEDSIRFAQLIAAEQSRKRQDSIRFINTEERLERVMESKIKSDSVIIREAMGIMKQQAGVSEDGLLGMQTGGSGSSIMSYVLIIFLIISLMVVTFLAANNRKPKTVYLKPKGSIKDKSKKDKAKKDADEKNDEDVGEVNPPPSTPPTSKPDEDAIRSELKTLRQTAVSLTVGEKEGASALIKEWLEDNPNKDEKTEESGEE